MHSYQHNIKTFNSATMHLTHVERALYRCCIEMYYDTEQPLPADNFDRLAKRLMANSNEEKEALKYVLDEFFTKTGNVYTHDYCDEEIEKYHANKSDKARAGKASAEARRKKAEERKAKRAAESSTDDEHNSTDVEQVFNSVKAEDQQNATNHKPLTNNHKPDKDTLEVNKNHIVEITQAASVCIALKRVYEQFQKSPHDISQTNPKFIECIKAGATEQEFIDAANNALRNGKGFAYICGTVFNQREEAKKLPQIHEGGMPNQHSLSAANRGIFGEPQGDENLIEGQVVYAS